MIRLSNLQLTHASAKRDTLLDKERHLKMEGWGGGELALVAGSLTGTTVSP